MEASNDLAGLERDAYRSAYSDGIVDLFLGFSLIFIGAVWIWAPDFGGLAGILPAVMVSSLLPFRKQIVEPRGGYVKWAKTRRRWERRSYFAMLFGGVLVFGLGVGVYLLASNSSEGTDVLGDIAPGLLAFILALMAIGIGFMMESPRLFAYAAALVVGGALTVMADANPGFPLFGAGLIITAVGGVMLARYLRENPVVDAS